MVRKFYFSFITILCFAVTNAQANCDTAIGAPHFEGKVVFLGFGSVAQAVMPLLFKHVKPRMQNVTVIDFADQRGPLKEWTKQNVNFVQSKITPETLDSTLSKYLKAGDVLIDLAWNIDTRVLLTWCNAHGVLYINTSTEVWDPYGDAEKQHPTDRTLYRRHMDLREMLSKWAAGGPTAVLEHGANPGLISHFVKQGIIDIAERCLADQRVPVCKKDEWQNLIKTQAFNELAMQLGIKVIHCSERDTQISNRPKEPGEFVNTWSVPGFHEEGTTTAEMGWGTHEKTLPAHAFEHATGPKNQICLARMGMNVWVRSRVPQYGICGMVIRHGEAFTLSDRLTVNRNGQAIYRPTVHYAYCPTDAAIASLHELRGSDYVLSDRMRIMNDDIITGSDILGALIMGHPYKSWWVGSDLSIEETRRLTPGQNATTLQVAISVVAAVQWMIANPTRGVLLPEDLPHDVILAASKPYLGKWVSEAINWTPLDDRQSYFGDYRKEAVDTEDPWQFRNFLIDLP